MIISLVQSATVLVRLVSAISKPRIIATDQSISVHTGIH